MGSMAKVSKDEKAKRVQGRQFRDGEKAMPRRAGLRPRSWNTNDQGTPTLFRHTLDLICVPANIARLLPGREAEASHNHVSKIHDAQGDFIGIRVTLGAHTMSPSAYPVHARTQVRMPQ